MKHRRVATIRDYDLAENCGHWTVEIQDGEPRAVDDRLMQDDEYWESHGSDYWGEVTLCFLTPGDWQIYSWCSADLIWEAEDERAYCERGAA